MTKFNRLMIVAILAIITTNSYSQSIGVKTGLNLSQIFMKDQGGNIRDTPGIKPGFHVGVFAELPVTGVFYFEPELLFSTKGYTLAIVEPLKYKANLNYIDIPLNAKAIFDIGGAKLYGVFGPYIGIGLSGKVKYENSTDDYNIKWGSESENDFKRFDFGLTFGAGVEIKSFILGASYEIGLANVSANTDIFNQISNRVIGISIGYKFNRK